jgi:hypothetical protein
MVRRGSVRAFAITRRSHRGCDRSGTINTPTVTNSSASAPNMLLRRQNGCHGVHALTGAVSVGQAWADWDVVDLGCHELVPLLPAHVGALIGDTTSPP